MALDRGKIEFRTHEIADIGSQTLAQQAEWDNIWNTTRNNISAVAADALDVATGNSLQQRSDEYHRKTQQYTQNVHQQGQVVNKIGDIATDTNARMVSTIRGGRRA